MDVVQQNQSSNLCHRASSVQMIINHVTRPPSDHPLSTQTFQNSQLPTPTKNRSLSSQSKLNQGISYWEEESKGFWKDLRMMRWMRHLGKVKLKLGLILFLSFISQFAHLQSWISYNPIPVFIKISYKLPQTAEEEANADQRYGKGLKDLPFLAFYVIVFSFLRQAVIKYFVKPYATWLGLRGTKLQRFADQGYAIFYWSSSTIICPVVMSGQLTWWYKTHEFWRGYPHYRMKSLLKTYEPNAGPPCPTCLAVCLPCPNKPNTGPPCPACLANCLPCPNKPNAGPPCPACLANCLPCPNKPNTGPPCPVLKNQMLALPTLPACQPSLPTCLPARGPALPTKSKGCPPQVYLARFKK
ncbi:TRAM1-like protein-domain-containing protein [Phakopsora pachyrhizi]|uniref:TRAM1-like protein-domain-containing protein n=1 Tax=Phakopsora pachyrhizi TaxID=170000 RepID=A0AAV0AEN7_PHAPC|nr:TRAM1-like protein-domain-containing protein [Phakopsora pachyrhizi]